MLPWPTPGEPPPQNAGAFARARLGRSLDEILRPQVSPARFRQTDEPRDLCLSAPEAIVANTTPRRPWRKIVGESTRVSCVPENGLGWFARRDDDGAAQ